MAGINPTLKEKLNGLKKSKIGKQVEARLNEFLKIKNDSKETWFSELCFCILAANSRSRTSWNIQKELGFRGFITLDQKQLSRVILKNKHRFHNTKARYIIANRDKTGIKDRVQSIIRSDGIFAVRKWLADSIIGFGYKEASHFLRNVGYFDLAILDRHILSVMVEHGLIGEIPTLSEKNYLKIEETFLKLAEKASMLPGELDMYLWYMKAGDVLK
ncbi:N-glycosylase/DNA lyase [Candidatus Woesearchaeota archaeon]|nr:N-glycosylase/DNA lyase [Candidatus Woesearchaeota archaeon]